MANKSFKLAKQVISNKLSNDLYGKDFKKLSKSTQPVDIKKIKEIYDSLFYIFNKKGTNAHSNIHEQSYNYINYIYNRELETKLNQKINTQSEKEAELNRLQTFVLPEHPIYSNGLFLIAGENGVKYQDMHTVYIMQEGRRRAFKNENTYKMVRRAMGLPEDFTGKWFLTVDELNSIDKGADINNTSDLLLEGTDLIVDDDVIQGISANITVLFTCDGNEVQDQYNLILEEDADASGQFYLGNGGCTIKYIHDPYFTDASGPTMKTVNLAKGEEIELTIPRPTDSLNNVVSDPQWANTIVVNGVVQNPFNIPPAITYNGNSINNYYKNWGPDGEYPGVIYAEGRIRSTERYNAHVSMNLGIAQDLTTRLFNGLPSRTYNPLGGEFWDVVPIPPNLGFEESNYGTRKIYPNRTGMWGSLGQSAHLQEHFNNMDWGYYKTTVHGLRIYGQPILDIDGRHLVMLKAFADHSGPLYTIARYFGFWDCDNKQVVYYRRKKIDHVITMDYKSNSTTVYKVNWGKSGKEHYNRMVFPGLQGYQLNQYQGNGNLYNPTGNGDNYGKAPMGHNHYPKWEQ